MTCARRILGAPKKTSHDAILVRLGWLPLEYLMMYRTIIWTLKAKRGLAGPALAELVSHMENCKHEKWERTRVFCPALHVLDRLSEYDSKGINFMLDSIPRVKRALRDCMFSELTSIWSRLKVARITRLVHPRWEKRTLPTSMFCRLSHVRYQCAALNRCPLRTRLAYFGKHISVKCRYGCAADEDLKHVLFHCPTIRKERDQVFEVCKEYGYKKTFKNLLTRRRLQMPMEKLIMKFTESKTA